VDLDGAGLAQHLDHGPRGGARTIESSTTTTRLPAMFSRSGLSFRRTPLARSAWVGAMKVRPM